MHLSKIFGMVMVVLLLQACGGGSEPASAQPPVAVNELPASAMVSSESFTRFAATIPATDSAEPMDVSKAEPAPSSDTTEPLPVD